MDDDLLELAVATTGGFDMWKTLRALKGARYPICRATACSSISDPAIAAPSSLTWA
jgi:hypothetical protein